MEEFDSDGSLLQLIDTTLERFLDDVAKKLLAAMASPKGDSLREFVEVRPERPYLLWTVE